MKKKAHPKAGQSNKQIHDNSTAVQRQRLETALREQPMSTLEIRKKLDILHPAGRVHELRHKKGLNIQTQDYREETQPGRLHTVARYVLFTGVYKERMS